MKKILRKLFITGVFGIALMGAVSLTGSLTDVSMLKVCAEEQTDLQNVDAELQKVSRTELIQNTKTHTFSNSSDGKFVYSYAKKSDYYVGEGVDESTGLKYGILRYDDKLWAVCISKKSGFLGSYDTSSFLANNSSVFHSATTKTKLILTVNNSGNAYISSYFFYADDYSILTTGVSAGRYYKNGRKASGIVDVNGNYDLFLKGLLVEKAGWHQYGSKLVKVSKGHVKYKFDGKRVVKYTGLAKKVLKKCFIDINGTRYRIDETGGLAQGFTKIKEDIYYFDKGVAVTNTLVDDGKFVYYLGDDGKAVKKQWVQINNTTRYFNTNGKNTKLFYELSYSDKSLAGKYSVYQKGSFTWITDGVYWINGELLYFKNGIHKQSNGWYNANEKTAYYIQKGYVVYKQRVAGGKNHLYGLENSAWKKVKSFWGPVKKGERFFYNSKGEVSRKYLTEKYNIPGYRRTVWDYNSKKKTWSKIKNEIVKIEDYYYYAGSDGVLKNTAGWYDIEQDSACYVDNASHVYAYFYYSEKKGCTVYKEGTNLGKPVAGVKRVPVNGKMYYYYIGANGYSQSGTMEIGGYIYTFDQYGRTDIRRIAGRVNWNSEVWMNRVINKYLGRTEIDCDAFIRKAFLFAGNTDPDIPYSLRYLDSSTGGIKFKQKYTCTDWVNKTVKASAYLSNGSVWGEKETIVLNEDIVDFSYDALTPGDVIVYYKEGETEASHGSIYLGRFVSANAVKAYLRKMGIAEDIINTCVKDWGTYYGNNGTYWCIHGGMGSNRQVYISNSCEIIPSGDTFTYAKKVINVLD